MPQSKRQLEMSVRLFCAQTGVYRLDALTHTLLNTWIDTNPRGWSPKTMRRRVGDVLSVWTYAYRIGATENSPQRLRVKSVRVPRRLPRAWSMDELQAMLAVARQFRLYLPNGVRRCDLLRAMILVGFYSALRPADLRTIRRDQLSPAGVPVSQAKKYGCEVLVRIPAWVIEEIDAGYPPDATLVYAWPHSHVAFYRLWKRMLTAAGLPNQKTEGLQKLRRSAVTYGELQQPGYGARLAGHAANSSVTYASYADPRLLAIGTGPQLPDLRKSTN